MILTIAAKEFLTCLLTWRFGLALVASVVLLSVSAVVLRADYARRLDAHEAELARIRADLEESSSTPSWRRPSRGPRRR